jgi:hypothetical protein
MLHLQTFKHRKMFKVEQHPAEREGEFWKNLKKKMAAGAPRGPAWCARGLEASN